MTAIATDVSRMVIEAVDQQLIDGETILRLEQPQFGMLQRSRGYGRRIAEVLLFASIAYVSGYFVTFGALWMLWFVGGALRDWKLTQRVAYVITNRRVIIMKVGLLSGVQTRVYAADMIAPRVTPHRRGTGGDIDLSLAHVSDSDTYEDPTLQGMRGLRDVKATEDALRQFILSWWNSTEIADAIAQSSSKSSL